MVNKKIEKDQVLIPCLNLCKKLKISEYILRYRRLDALDYYHENGDPDIEIWIPNKSIVIILMAECKKPIGGIVSPDQHKCKKRYSDFTNVYYQIITDALQLKKIVMELSDRRIEGFDEFNNIKDL